VLLATLWCYDGFKDEKQGFSLVLVAVVIGFCCYYERYYDILLLCLILANNADWFKFGLLSMVLID
jgi:hypothetical protein